MDGKTIEITKEGAELGPDDPLDITIEVDAAKKGQTMVLHKIRIGKYGQDGEGDDEGLKSCASFKYQDII